MAGNREKKTTSTVDKPYFKVELEAYKGLATQMIRRAALIAATVAAIAGTADGFVSPGNSGISGFGLLREHAVNVRSSEPRLRPATISLDMAEGASAGPVSRKAKNKQKKASKAQDSAAQKEKRKQVDAILDELFDEIESKKRDLTKMNTLLDKIGEFKPEAIAPTLKGDWKLVFVDSAEAIHQVGSGLGKLPGSSIEDLFATFDVKGTVKIQEVVRVVGPFPTVRNELSGTWEYKDKSAGFTGDSITEPVLECTYTEMVDGRNKKTTLETGFKQKSVQLDVQYADPDVLIAFIQNDGLQPLRLVFEKELELNQEMGRLLRQDITRESQPGAGAPLNPIIALAELAKGEKKPWEFWK